MTIESLALHVLNVGHGDSIVVEASYSDGSNRFSVIDCNIRRDEDAPPALALLRKLGATRLESAVITHFHHDHIRGMETILAELRPRRLLIPPVLSTKTALLKKILKQQKKRILKLLESTDDKSAKQAAYSMAKIIAWIVGHQDKVEELSGPRRLVALLPGLDAAVVLPTARIKGVIHRHLEDEGDDVELFADDHNDTSIALTLDFADTIVALCGDATLSQWRLSRRICERDEISRLSARVIKAPHHGSKHNNTDEVYDFLEPEGAEKSVVLVSASGQVRPQVEFFRMVSRRRLLPYCTGLSACCMPENVVSMRGLQSLPPAMRAFVANYETAERPVACQGDIRVRLSRGKPPSISTSVASPCIYRM